MFSFLLLPLSSSKPSMYSSSFSVQYFHFQLKNQSRLNKTVELRGCDMPIFLFQFCDLDNAIRQFFFFFNPIVSHHLLFVYLFALFLGFFFKGAESYTTAQAVLGCTGVQAGPPLPRAGMTGVSSSWPLHPPCSRSPVSPANFFYHRYPFVPPYSEGQPLDKSPTCLLMSPPKYGLFSVFSIHTSPPHPISGHFLPLQSRPL